MSTGIKPVKELVAEANKVITTFSIDEARALQDAGDAVILDIRDVRELWREGTVPGALHMPRGMLEFWADPESPYHKDVFVSGKTLILYCASAWRSALATKSLQDMGVPNVAHMEGGFSAWKERKLPIHTVSQH
mgnify:FL=1